MNNNKISVIKKSIADLLEEEVEKLTFPSYAVGVCLDKKNSSREWLIVSGQRKMAAVNNDRKKKYYDLASLTKPLATVLSIVSLAGAGKLALDDRLDQYLPGTLPPDKRVITIRQLLNHSSGLPAHRPYFETLQNLTPPDRPGELRRLVLAEKLKAPPTTIVTYSDLGYLLLGMIVEELSGLGLAQYFSERIAGPLGLAEGIFFNPLDNSRKARDEFFPTENCLWRGKVLQGEVSDENCWALGGVAGHAGLFGDIESVMGLTSAILDIWQGRREHPHIRREELALFLEAKSEVAGSTWALGFDRPTPGGSSSGKYLSPSSVGHLGFTGTSFWIDPDKGLVVVLLTNRVHPNRDNVLIREFRPLFHDRVVELLGLV